jgi:hypothetical protein
MKQFECENQSDPENLDEHDGYKLDWLCEIRTKLLNEQQKCLHCGMSVPPSLAIRTEEVENRIKNIEKKISTKGIGV